MKDEKKHKLYELSKEEREIIINQLQITRKYQMSYEKINKIDKIIKILED